MGPQLTDDEIADVLYFARVGDCGELLDMLKCYCTRENTSYSVLFLTAKDPHTNNGPLHMAAANGHTEVLTKAIKVLSDPSPQNPAQLTILNSQNAAGNTALHWAALNGHLACVKVLIDAGADPTIANAAGHDAVYDAELNDQKEVVDWVLKEAEGLEEGIGKSNETEKETDEAIAEEGAHSKAGGDEADAKVLETRLSNMTVEDET